MEASPTSTYKHSSFCCVCLCLMSTPKVNFIWGWRHGLNSHPTDWKSPGIEQAIPGLIQYITAAPVSLHHNAQYN